METIEPLANRVLIRKDEPRTATKGGIILPDSAKIENITGRVIAIASDVDILTIPIKIYDKVLVDPSNAIPVELEQGNKLYLIEVKDIIAVFRRIEQEVEVPGPTSDEPQ